MRCRACGSSMVDTGLHCQPGINTIMGTISTLVGYFTGFQMGMNMMGAKDVKVYHYCARCGSRDIQYDPGNLPPVTRLDGGGSGCGCMFLAILIIALLYVALTKMPDPGITQDTRVLFPR